MIDLRTRRMSREVFLATIGGNLGPIEPWVTDRLTALLEEEDATAGDCIFQAGDPPDHIVFLREGRIELVAESSSSEVIEAPRAFGMVDALLERPRVVSAFARTPVQLLKIRMDAWFELLEDSFDLARMAVQMMVRAVAALEQQLLAAGRAPARVAAVALEAQANLDLVERLVLLTQALPLSGAGVQPLSDLATASEEVSFEPGAMLFERHAIRPPLLVVIAGEFEASREDPGLMWRGSSGQVVAGTAAFEDGRNDWQARAVTRLNALSFGIEDWFDVMEENFDMVRSTLAALALERERLVTDLPRAPNPPSASA
jgi:CRP-like cAMP-binding protein